MSVVVKFLWRNILDISIKLNLYAKIAATWCRIQCMEKC